jgi:hypothetical protein
LENGLVLQQNGKFHALRKHAAREFAMNGEDCAGPARINRQR